MPNSFREAIQSAGLNPPEHIEPGPFHRFPGIGKRNGNTAGWCKLFPDGQGGTYGDYSTGLSESWQVDREQPFTEAERAAFRRQVQESKRLAEEQRHQEQQAAATKANAILTAAVGDPAGHAYAMNKKVALGPRVKRGPWAQRGWPDALLVPMFDESGVVVSVQAINVDGGKDFLVGGRKKGTFHPLGKIRGVTGRVLIGEGLATVAAAVSATGLPGVVAFDAGNLPPVAEVVRRLAPAAEIIILADDDQKPDAEKNAGIEAATHAALAVGGLVALPTLGRKCDFWDVLNEQGADAVRQAIDAAAPAEDQYMAPPEQPEQVDPATESPAKIRPIGIHEFLTLEFPPRHNLLSPWLPSQGLGMVYASRGIGKTHFALGVAYAVTSGGQFLGWHATEPAGVLYLDGEMPGVSMQDRISAIAASNDLEPVAPFTILTPDLQPAGMPRIDTPEGQEAIESILTPAIKLIIVDNISTLCRTKENEADGWTPVQAWALQQRAVGRSVLFVHHAGKGGQQRGTSRREDVLDTVLSLRRPVDYCPDQGAVFEVHFEKARGIYGEDVKPLEARLTTSENGLITWTTRTVEAGMFDRVTQLLSEGLKQHEIVAELGLSKGTVSKYAKRAKAEGLVVTA